MKLTTEIVEKLRAEGKTLREIADKFHVTHHNVWQMTPKGRLLRKRYQKAYRQTDNYKAYQKEYEKTDKRKAYKKKYLQTDWAKMLHRHRYHLRIQKVFANCQKCQDKRTDL